MRYFTRVEDDYGRMLGHSVSWRFSRGEPFHAGAFWRGMDTGLRAMSSALAS